MIRLCCVLLLGVALAGCEIVSPQEESEAFTCDVMDALEPVVVDTANVPLAGTRWTLVQAVTDTTAFGREELAAMYETPWLAFDATDSTAYTAMCKHAAPNAHSMRGYLGCNEGIGCYEEAPCEPQADGGCRGAWTGSLGTSMRACLNRQGTVEAIFNGVIDRAKTYEIHGRTLTLAVASDTMCVGALRFEAE